MATEPDPDPSAPADDGYWSSRPDVPFATPGQSYERADALRVVLPGGTAQSAALSEPVTKPLVQTLLDAVDAATVATVEQLVFPTQGALEHVLYATPARARADGRATDQRTLADYDEGFHRSATATLQQAAAKRLPERIGLERIDLDFRPLGLSPVPTCRLVIPEDQRLAPGVTLAYHPLVRTLRALHADLEPYVYQVLVGKQRGSYLVSIRLATYDPAHNFTTERGFKRHVTEGHDYDLATTFADLNAASNFRIPVSTRRLSAHRASSSLDAVDASAAGATWLDRSGNSLYRLVAGKCEHQRLLQGTANYDEQYTKQDVYPRFRATAPQVGLFATLTPQYYARDPWMHAPYRDAPAITTQEIVRAADGTPQATGSRTAATERPEPTVQNEGSPTHVELVTRTAQWFREQGDEIQPVEQDTTSVPDLRVTPTDGRIAALDGAVSELTPRTVDADVVPVEVEHTSRSKAANLLTNAARAALADRLMLVVCPTERAARTAIEQLREPFKQPADHGLAPSRVAHGATDRGATHLYNMTKHVTLASGATPLLPAGCTEADWLLTPTGQLRCEADGRVIARGDAATSVRTYDYDTPRYRQADSGDYVVTGPDGDRLATYTSDSALVDDWTRLHPPHVPVELSYLERAVVLYQDGDDFVVVKPTPEWDVEQHTDRYEGAVERFFGTYIAAADGTELAYDTFRERALLWYARQTDRKPPSKSYFGEAMPFTPGDEEMKSRDNNRLHLFRDRTWIVPPEVVSPDLPGYTDDEETAATDSGEPGDR